MSFAKIQSFLILSYVVQGCILSLVLKGALNSNKCYYYYSIQYTVLCGNEGLNLVIETTHTHYLTFHTDNVEGGGTGFKLEYTLEPYQKITPGEITEEGEINSQKIKSHVVCDG